MYTRLPCSDSGTLLRARTEELVGLLDGVVYWVHFTEHVVVYDVVVEIVSVPWRDLRNGKHHLSGWKFLCIISYQPCNYSDLLQDSLSS